MSTHGIVHPGDSVIAYTRRHRDRRDLTFEDLTFTDLTVQQRTVLARDWRHRMGQEHLAVGAFTMLAMELAAEGCREIVLSLVTRAASDEVAHAEVCRRLAEAFLGREVPHRQKGVPSIPKHPTSSGRDRCFLHLAEMCCIGETLTTCFFSESIARATSPVIRRALTFLLEDEIDHARVGWAHLADASQADRAGIAEALPSMLERTVGWLPAAIQRTDAGDDKLEAYGYLRPSTLVDVYQRSLREVVLAGFEDLRIDIGPAMRYAVRRGMLAGARTVVQPRS